MRFFYLDPGLRDNVGHQANTCRAVTSELRRRGVETFVAASAEVTDELKAEVNARPIFKYPNAWLQNGEPVAGWLSVFLQGTTATTGELMQLPPTQAGDVVFLNSALPVQLMAIANWVTHIPPDRRPRVVIEFGIGPGLEAHKVGDTLQYETIDPRQDPRSVLYRHIGNNIPAEIRQHLVLTTFDPISSNAFAFATGIETKVLPLPQQAYWPPRTKVGKRPLTVSVLGHQRWDKGYQLMPEVIPILLARHQDICFLAHNAAPDQMADTQAHIRALAENSLRVIVDERPADDRHWRYLFAASDIILCPYKPLRYLTSYSALAVEALANGIPAVVPDETSLSRFLIENEGGVVTFSEMTPQAIANAASLALQAFDDLADAAFEAAQSWNNHDRKALLVDAILGEAH